MWVTYPNQARVIFKCRCQTMDIKAHLTYKYNDKICRRCGKEEETLSHVINCESSPLLEIDVCKIGDVNEATRMALVLMVNRIETFIEKVE